LERHVRLREFVDLILALGAEEVETHDGHECLLGGKLHARPAVPPKIFRAAVTAETARWVDGLLTVGGAPEAVRQRLEAFAKGGGPASR
jgi:alkanesulfonate monooxygenase SsuD/methylene tetrahydromethanopterin reductase-like flavin-dependent oxidoreductase (luciferase family)